MRAAHGAEVRGLGAVLRQRFVVELARGHGVEREIELIFPAEFKACLGDGVVAVLRAGMGHWRGGHLAAGGEWWAGASTAGLHVFLVRQAQVFPWRDAGEHPAA